MEPVSADETVDAWISASDVTIDLADELRLLEPFGEGNEEPVFGLRDVAFSDARPLGSDGRHLSVTLRGSGLRCFLWNGGDRVESLRASGTAPHTIRFHVVVSEYGERHVELRLLSVD